MRKSRFTAAALALALTATLGLTTARPAAAAQSIRAAEGTAS